MTTAELGQLGEDIAAEAISERGWDIIDRNWRCPSGEIDIIALDRQANILVFVEVKSRRSANFGPAISAVHWKKQQRLHKLVWHWWESNCKLAPTPSRIDVIGIQFHARQPALVTWIEAAA